MRLACAFILAAAGAALACGQAEARVAHRAHGRAAGRPAAAPAHGMSALARAQARARQEQGRRQGRLLADERDGMSFGAFRRDYGLSVPRQSVRPDQDGAVGLSWRMKTRD